ncbi:MAG: cytochrome c biogenesis protein CcdA [Desulfuromonadia bacterium]
MEASAGISVFGAFLAGLLSFLSPCVLPLIPSYLTFISGLTIADLKGEGVDSPHRLRVILHSLVFIAGFTTIFVLLGVSASLIGTSLQPYMGIVRKVGGGLVVIFGIHVTGLVPIHLLFGERRLQIRNKPAGFIGTYLVGIAFAAGWTPCIGPILASILMLAATEETVARGFWLLLVYSLGLGVPFLATSVAIHSFFRFFDRFKRFFRVFEIVTGLFLVIVGIMIYFNWFRVLAGLLPPLPWG